MRILDAAAQVVSEAGLGGATVRAVATAAGVGMGTLRHYFPTQRDLHDEVVRRVLEDTIQDFDIRDASRDSGDRLVRCMLQFLPDDATAQELLNVWFGLYRHALEPGANGLSRQFLEVAIQRAHRRVGDWLEILADEGAVDRGRIPELVLLLNAVISGVCLEIITPGSAMTLGAARNIVSGVIRSLIVKETR
ncbi:TetR/AcrR family transcriptional regulator [Cryobacterium sp. Y50]|uniref:TetR/AcrR family transcriptional regulator n=1 Tax=Cryobacterium sp. Y50 TaxID=2048286 RepID=UPI001304CD46|nr:TetR/AcrR family transcriptional regulator [Cryobacterium sp. Y50]